jgi:phosphoesterase RecJ-like protein
LGLYTSLKAYGKRVEVANHSRDLPPYLDFLPHFSKIKHTIDFDDSLIVACDCGSIDRLGFDVQGREIVNIDHHRTNHYFGTVNLVDPLFAASAQVASMVLEEDFPITAEVATCFYAAFLSDTRYFTVPDIGEEALAFAAELIARGADHERVVYNFTQRRSLASIRILARALTGLTLHLEAQVASIRVDREMIHATGAKMSDMEELVDYARSLATVEIGILLVEEESRVRVSLRSKHIDISPIAEHFGGGGHAHACGFTTKEGSLEAILDRILQEIERHGYLPGSAS